MQQQGLGGGFPHPPRPESRRTSGGSPLLASWVAPFSATCLARPFLLTLEFVFRTHEKLVRTNFLTGTGIGLAAR